MDYVTAQGIRMPRLGLGTFRMTGADCRAAVESALGLGYRHIDTAAMYANEDAVGSAIAASGIARSDLHVTTKVWHDSLAPAAIRRSLEASLGRLQLDYVDLYMVHWPSPEMDLPGMFRMLDRLRQEGSIRAIGVCNFTLKMLRRSLEEFDAPIACHQIEYHAFLDQTPMRRYLAERGIPLTAYCPLAQGRAADSAELQAIGRKHGASAAQVALKWLLDQDNVLAVPKAQRPASQQANLEALDLTLDDEDRRVIAALPKDRRLVSPAFAPDWD